MPAAALDRSRTSSTGAPERDRLLRETPRRPRGRPSGESARRDRRSAAARVATVRPSRSTVMRSASAEDLLEPVRDVDDADLLLAQPRDRRRTGLSTSRSVSEAVGSSISTIAGVGADRLGDLDDLLLGHAQRVDGRARDRSTTPTRASSAAAPSRRALPVDRAASAPPRSSASAMFSATVRCGKSAGCW